MRKNIVFWLKKNLNSTYWEAIWWLLPISAILILPVGSVALQILMRVGLDEAPRLTQLLMIFSLFYGPICGTAVLLLIKYADFDLAKSSKIKWLARLSIVSPIVTLLGLFWLFRSS